MRNHGWDKKAAGMILTFHSSHWLDTVPWLGLTWSVGHMLPWSWLSARGCGSPPALSAASSRRRSPAAPAPTWTQPNIFWMNKIFLKMCIFWQLKMGSAELGGGITNTFQACHYLSRLLQCKLPVELSSDLLLTVCIHAALGPVTVSQYAAN